ncbi:MAG TPA: hypothetical protein VHM20_04410 [Gammaproteobacteria bacterium]|nr:hypothetical protein [Gammaproteobacteria bacterium]
MMRKIIILFFIIFATTALAHSDHGSHLGNIYFQTSGSQAAQPFFIKGVKLLHSFEYSLAIDAFREALKCDSHFAMAYWGMAMTYNHPLWNEQDYEEGAKILKVFAKNPQERIQKAKLPIEKGFINAINLLYGPGTKKARDIAYKDAMQKLYQQHPEHSEVALFYALSLLGSTGGERDIENYMKAAGIAEIIYQKQQDHPGVLHYLLHTYDDPVHAPLGLRAARAFAAVAPDASHALHMPSHVFFALGLWDDVIRSNQMAWDAGLKNNTQKDPKEFSVHDLHALQWLSYGYLQKHDYQKSYELTRVMQDIAIQSNLPMVKWYYAMMRSAYLTESKNWNAKLQSLDMSDVEISAKITNMYADALIALHDNCLEQAKKIYQKMLLLIPDQLKEDTFKEYFTSITSHGVKIAKIIAKELYAEINYPLSFNTLKEAIKEDKEMGEGYGPPVPVKPPTELLGDFYIMQKRCSAAIEQYKITLKRFPNRYLSMQGLPLCRAKTNRIIP